MLILSYLFFSVFFKQPQTLLKPIPEEEVIKNNSLKQTEENQVLAEGILDLNNRSSNHFLNEIYKYNILLALWRLPLNDLRSFKENNLRVFVLEPNAVFAFHEILLDEFKNRKVISLGSRFAANEGFKSSGVLVGDGVCHLASFINWIGQKAGLSAKAPVSHNFQAISGVPKEYWVSIKYDPFNSNSSRQNLYLSNNFPFAVKFQFLIKEDGKIELKIIKLLKI